MSRDNNLTNHEVYDSFFASDKQKEEFKSNKRMKRGFLAFIGCILLGFLVGYIEVSIVGAVGGIFNLCIAAAFISFLYALSMLPCGDLFAIGSVLVALLSLVIMITNIQGTFKSINNTLGPPWAIAAVALILGVPNLLSQTVFLAIHNQKAKKKKRQRPRVALIIVAGIGCSVALATIIIGIVRSLETIT